MWQSGLRTSLVIGYTGGAMIRNEREQPVKVVGEGSDSPTPSRLPLARWRLDRRTVLNGLAAVIFLAVGAATFAFIHKFSVNVVSKDQWSDINVIRYAHTGRLSFGLLWAQHNEDRILFPNLVVLLLAYTTHFNVVIEDFMNGVLCCAAVALLILAHKRRSPTISWIWYCPVALVGLSFGSIGGATFGFNLSWYLALFSLAGCLYVLDRVVLTWLALVGAASFAVIGSFSSLKGLYIWPAAMLLLILRRRSRPMVLVWATMAVATAVLYFVNFKFSHAEVGSSVGQNPGREITYFFTVIGNVFGATFRNTPDAGNTWLLMLGVLVFVLAIWAVANVIANGRSGGGPIGVALICYGLIFVSSITYGRSNLGIQNAARYMVFTLTIWVGAYLALLEPVEKWTPEPRSATLARLDHIIGLRELPEGLDPIPRTRVVSMVALVALLGLVAVQVIAGDSGAIDDADAWHANQLMVADLTANVNQAPEGLLNAYLGPAPAGYFRSMAGFARSQQLSLFDTSLAAEDQRRGIPPSLLRPIEGTKLSGTQTLIAYAAVKEAATTTVQFRVTGGGLRDDIVSVGKHTLAEWVGIWDTTTVANGGYRLQSVVLRAGTVESRSSPVVVVVENRPD